MRFSLRVLLIVMLLAGPLCAWGWKEWRAYQERLVLERATPPSLMMMQPTIWINPPPASSAGTDAAGRELWIQERDKRSWESFPESEREAK